jgi:hypothetical protein
VPVPLPTYVSKPPAPRRAPPIDLTDPGSWSAAQAAPSAAETSAEESRPSAAPPGAMSMLLDAAEAAEDELDAIIHRRAVND